MSFEPPSESAEAADSNDGPHHKKVPCPEETLGTVHSYHMTCQLFEHVLNSFRILHSNKIEARLDELPPPSDDLPPPPPPPGPPPPKLKTTTKSPAAFVVKSIAESKAKAEADKAVSPDPAMVKAVSPDPAMPTQTCRTLSSR